MPTTTKIPKTVQIEEKYSPSLEYLQNVCAWGGFFYGENFGRINQNKWKNILSLMWHFTSLPLTISMSNLVFQSSNSPSNYVQLFSKFKPGTMIVYYITNGIYFLMLFVYAIFSLFNGKRILQAANHKLYSIFDCETNFRFKFIIYNEIILFTIVIGQNYFWFAVFLQKDITKIVLLFILCYLNIRKQLWVYQIQTYVLKATNHWFDRLIVAANRDDMDHRILFNYVCIVNQLLECLHKFYAILGPYLIIEYVSMFSLVLLTFLMHMIRLAENKMEIVFTITCTIYILAHTFIVWLAFLKLCEKFAQLRAILVRQAIRFKAQPQIRLWCLGSIARTDLFYCFSSSPSPPPQVVGLFQIDLYNLLTTLLFVFDFSAVLYQTEYM